jgi:propionaldehyde dehydrogenase
MQTEEIAKIVGEVLKRLESQGGLGQADSAPAANARPDGGQDGGLPSAACGVVFPTVDEAVSVAAAAQKKFRDLGVVKRREIIRAMRKVSVDNAERMAKLAAQETGLGRAEDKVQKNLICALKTPGVEDLESRAYTGDTGLTLVEYAPYGVVAAITPSTNPVATIINNAISVLSAGNAVFFAQLTYIDK